MTVAFPEWLEPMAATLTQERFTGPESMARAFILAGVIAVALLAIVLLRPVCVPLSDDDLKSFNVPIEQRTDTDIYLRVFQRRDGHWYQ